MPNGRGGCMVVLCPQTANLPPQSGGVAPGIGMANSNLRLSRLPIENFNDEDLLTTAIVH